MTAKRLTRINANATEGHTMTGTSTATTTRQTRSQETALRDRLESDLAAVIVQELWQSGAKGFYIVLSSEVPGLQLDGNLGGMTHPNVASWLRPEIGNRWRGNGPGMLLVDGPGCSPEWLTAKAIHETAHIATSIELFSNPSPTAAAALKGLVKTPPRSWPAHRGAVAWRGHGLDFVRAVFHIAYRMTARGHNVCPALLLNWQGCGYRTPWQDYYAALINECDQRESDPISEIHTSVPPAGFMRLWAADLHESKNLVPSGVSVTSGGLFDLLTKGR